MNKRIKKDFLKGDVLIETKNTEKYLTFSIDNQVYALESKQVVEIIPIQPITLIPKLPSFVNGVINLRGKIIPVINLRLRLEKDAIAFSEESCIIITETDEITVGLIVDCVNDVIDIAKENINEYSKLTADSSTSYVCGICKIDNNPIMILDTIKIFVENN